MLNKFRIFFLGNLDGWLSRRTPLLIRLDLDLLLRSCMISVAIRSVFWLRFVLLGHKSVLVGFCGLISCATHVCNGFVQPYVWFLLLIRVLIGSHVSSIKVLLVRFTRERFTIFKPTVRLKDRRADVPRGQRLFAFSVYTANYHELTTTSIGRNFLEEKTNANSTSRHLLRKGSRCVPVLFRKVDSDWSAVDISTCLRLSEWQICIFWPLTIIFSTLRVSTFISLAHDTVQ